MNITASLHEKDFSKKKFVIVFMFLMCAGAVCGTLLAFSHCRHQLFVLPSLHELSVMISSRSIKQILIADALFPILILLCSCFGLRKTACFCLFFFKGFLISYLFYLFVFFFQAHGFLFATAVFLLHSLLLLPIQMTTAFLLSFQPEQKTKKQRLPVLLAANAAAVLLCAFLEQFFIPYFHTPF